MSPEEAGNGVKEIVKALKEESGVFRLFDEADLEKVAPFFEDAAFSPGEVIFNEGDPPDYVAFVKNGRVEVRKETEFFGKQIVLGHMSKGSIFGEIALFDDQPRSAAAVATGDTELLILRREAIESFFEAHPALGIKMLKGISRVQAIRLRQLTERLVLIF